MDFVDELRAAADVNCDGPYDIGGRLSDHDSLLCEAADEIERLRSWIDRQEPVTVYEAKICPVCRQATEWRFWLPVEVEPHDDGCPWRVEQR